MIKVLPAAAATILLTLPFAAARAGAIERIVIDTDRSVNCATLATIVRDVTAGCKTDQAKAVALYDFVVRTVWMPYVYGQPKEMIGGRLASVRDPLKVLNVYGAAGCDIQADVFCTLADAAGLGARRLAPGFAHGSNEIKWGGKWHWMDVWLPCYLLNEKGEIYSYDELMADRSLVDKAVADGRISPNWMFNPGPDIRTVKKARKHRAAPPGSGVKKCKYVEDLALRPGESCTWLWDHVGKWYWPGEKYACPAFKFPADKNCKQAFPYWQPYVKKIRGGPHPGGPHVYYRYYGNAIFEHRVPLTKAGLAAWGAKLNNIIFTDAGPGPAGGKAGWITLAFRVPYVIADTEIAGEVELGKKEGVLFEYSLDAGKSWKGGRMIEQSAPFEKFSIGKPNSKQYPTGATSGQYGFLLRVGLSGGSTLKALKVTNTTMLNFYSRPQLEVGKNNVTVTAKDDKALKATPLEITWRWLEDWTKEKTFTHKVATSGAKAVIEVGGTKRPKMKSITIACPAGTGTSH